MRAVLLNNVPRHTGIGRYTLSLYSALKRLGLLSVDLVDLSLEIDLNFPGVRKLEIAIHLGKSLFRSPKGYDIYHLPNQFIGMASLWTRPSVISIHDAFSLTSGFVMNSLYGRGLSFALSSSMVICPSEFSRQQTIHTIGLDSSKTSVIFPGIDHSVFHKRDKEKCRQRLGLSQDSKIVLNVSTTLKYKNIPTLLEMFKIISEREPRALLIRVGYPNPSTPELNALANKLGISTRVIYMKPMDEDLPFLYNAADVYVHTSRYEGFGLPVGEAMASGLPVVSSNAASLPEVISNAGTLLDPSDVEGFASQALSILQNKKLQEEFAERSYLRGQVFDWDSCARQTYEVYKQAISSYLS